MKIKQILRTLTLMLAALVMFSCSKEESELPLEDASEINELSQTRATGQTTNLQGLINYKSSDHELMAGYYRTWLDKATSPTGGSTVMTNLPDSLDIVIVFEDFTPANSPYWTALKNTYIPYLHARGTKVIYTGNPRLSAGQTHNAAGYAARAAEIMSRVNEYNFDGFDIDIESNPTGTELADITGVMHALSSSLGPQSGTGKLLTLDTNKNGDNNVFRNIDGVIDYVFLQAYGRGSSTLQGTFNTYKNYISADQFIPGFSFYEENGANWRDVNFPDNGQGRCYDYAGWQPTGNVKKGGIFSYAIDRDLSYKTDNRDAPDYKVTQRLIAVMNPPKINIALNKTATHSNTGWLNYARYAVDGNTSGDSGSHTFLILQPWWEVDLGQVATIDEIRLYNRTNLPTGRLSNYHIFVSDVPFTSISLTGTQAQSGVSDFHNTGVAGRPTVKTINRTGRYVRIQRETSLGYLSIAEVEVIGNLP